MIDRRLGFTTLVLEWGPVPPSGGPDRERYLAHGGRKSLREFADEYEKAVATLGDRASRMPMLDFELTEEDDEARSAIQRQKRYDWADFSKTLDEKTINAIEPHARKAVAAAVAALNFLEDHELREEAHTAVHTAAFLQRGLFGCPIVLRDNAYWTDCPINVSHLRMGASVGMVSDWACSVCGRLLEDCDHVVGEPYAKVAQIIDSQCSICGAGVCGHVVGRPYVVVASANAVNAVLLETSFVARPRYPQARIVELTQDFGDAGDSPQFRAAVEHGALDCDCDLGPCAGLNDMAIEQLVVKRAEDSGNTTASMRAS